MESINLNMTADAESQAALVKQAKEEITKYYFEVTDNYLKDEMSEEEKQKMYARIRAKLKAGKKLTSKELEFLRKNDPIMYQRALRIQKMAENVKNQLKQAKSKQQANMIISQSMGGISDKDPDKEYMVAAINRIATEFRKSGAYSRLPATDEEAMKKGKKVKVSDKDFGDDSDDNSDNDSDIDLFNWTPLQEIIDSLPKFNVNV